MVVRRNVIIGYGSSTCDYVQVDDLESNTVASAWEIARKLQSAPEQGIWSSVKSNLRSTRKNAR